MWPSLKTYNKKNRLLKESIGIILHSKTASHLSIRTFPSKMALLATLIAFLLYIIATIASIMSSFMAAIALDWPVAIRGFFWAVPCKMASFRAMITFIFAPTYHLGAISGNVTHLFAIIAFVSLLFNTILCQMTSVPTFITSAERIIATWWVWAFACNVSPFIASVAKSWILYIF